ncbi:MAG TPA: CHAP domain-containing protein [Solirubrobacterales bacterium]
MLPSVRTTKDGRAAVRWVVASNAPSGTWTVAAECGQGKNRVRAEAHLFLINRGSGKGPLVVPDSAAILDSGLGGKGGTPCALDEHGKPVCFPGNPYNYYQGGSDVGQCTWYAAGRRPDLYNITTGNAKQWLAEASGRKPEGSRPVPGAIAVQTGGPYGHVMYVTAVLEGGNTVVVDDANYRNDTIVRYGRHVPTDAITGFIYGGPVGSGPPSGSGGTGETPEGGGGAPGGTPGKGPSIAINPSNGLATAVAEGPSNSLYAYWQTAGGSWTGPLGIDGGKAGIAY